MRLILGYRIPGPHAKPTWDLQDLVGEGGHNLCPPVTSYTSKPLCHLSLSGAMLQGLWVRLGSWCTSAVHPGNKTHLPLYITHQTSWETILIGGSFYDLVTTAIQLVWRHRIFAAGREDLALRNTKNILVLSCLLGNPFTTGNHGNI